MKNEIVIIGLGPGDFGQLTLEAWDELKKAEHLYLRTAVHPVVDRLKSEGIDFESFDSYYEKAENFTDLYSDIVKKLVEYAEKYKRIHYAVPGSPCMAESTVERLRAVAGASLDIRIVSGMSFLEPMLDLIGYDPCKGLKILDAFELETIKIDTQVGNIIVQMYDNIIAGNVKLALLEILPGEFPVKIVRYAGVKGKESMQTLELADIDRIGGIDYLTTLFVPPAPEFYVSGKYPLDPLIDVMAELRRPDGCPWDIEQDHKSLRPYLIEEACEVIEAINEGDYDKIMEELGDLLLQVVFHAHIACENDEFDINDVVDVIVKKMIRRHPHVFGDVKVENTSHVLRNWEIIKAEEKEKFHFLLDTVPNTLPSLLYAEKQQKKASNIGFDWDTPVGAWEKLLEEIDEFGEAIDKLTIEEQEDEMGDILFSMVNVARLNKLSAEICLIKACNKFRNRFNQMEELANTEGLSFNNLSIDVLDSLWTRVKASAIE